MKQQPPLNIVKKVTGLSLLAMICLMIVNVFLSAQVSQDGLMIDSISKQEEAVRQEINQLEQSLMSKTSLVDLSAKAQELGFGRPEQVISVAASQQVAANK